MNSNFNRQFIMLDFRLLQDRRFLKFVGSSEFATYLVLRSHVWRSAQSHYMGLEAIYEQASLRACSLTREKIAAVTGVAQDNISRHLSNLEEGGTIRRLRTGRQNIYILGEWVDVYGDGSYRVEWFYMDGQFGLSKSDLTDSVRSDLTNSSDQTRRTASGLTRRVASDNNRELNRENNKTVNGEKPHNDKEQKREIKTTENGNESIFSKLPNLTQPTARTQYVAHSILEQLGDQQSARFYNLIAASPFA